MALKKNYTFAPMAETLGMLCDKTDNRKIEAIPFY